MTKFCTINARKVYIFGFIHNFYNFPKLETSYDFPIGLGLTQSSQYMFCSVSLRMKMGIMQFKFCFPKFTRDNMLKLYDLFLLPDESIYYVVNYKSDTSANGS